MSTSKDDFSIQAPSEYGCGMCVRVRYGNTFYNILAAKWQEYFQFNPPNISAYVFEKVFLMFCGYVMECRCAYGSEVFSMGV